MNRGNNIPKNRKPKEKTGKFSDKILKIFYETPAQLLNYKQLSKRLGIDEGNGKQQIIKALIQLKGKGLIEEVQTGSFKVIAKTAYVTGRIDLTSAGYGFLISEEMEQDVFISVNNLNHALKGDTVKVFVYPKRFKDRPEGEVIEIINRARNTFVGIIELSKNFAFLITDNNQMPYDLFIPLDKLKGAKSGQKAIARITDWPERVKNPFGEVVEVLGYPGNSDVEMHAILAEFELPFRFPAEVEKAAEQISDVITKEEISKRRDFRDITTFTIDPADAKDFDDALSIRSLENKTWEVGVHIADVSHYVKTGSLLDQQGYERGTSVYLVDRVVPMLPEKLSNNVCSLRPNEDKLCFSAVFKIDEEAHILDEWYGRTIINSNHRFSYEDAQQVIETGKGELENEILTLHDLAQKLRVERFKSGSIGFDRVEVKFYLDETGKPTGVYFKENKESNQLIEEFMLLANRKVAAFITGPKGNKNNTFVYRVHDKPNSEKLENFSKFITKFGYHLKLNNKKNISKSLNELLEEVKGKKEQNLIETLAVRSMAKAEYSTKNIGHYGLGFDKYTHFTSPIRRYPDVLSHRLLQHYLDGGKPVKQSEYEDMCRHSSDMEKKAVEAERASIKYKQVEFMSDKIGQKFAGVISGVTEWGIFVEITENKCEGLIPVRQLDDDFYEFDEENYCLLGKQTGRKFQLGDEVMVEIWRTNLAKKQLDLMWVKEEEKIN